ncbi:MAG: HAD-IA family hydrolase [Burkholderiales bacterium]|nr:HAD-IA family hydrolase [Burkholderiales bacterium]
MHPIRSVIFDLDGTLADTAGEIALALQRAFAEFDLATLPETEVRALIGRGVASLIVRALQRVGSGVDAAEVIERFETHYEATAGSTARLYPGAREGLDRLLGSGVPLAVATNKPRLFTERLLDHLWIRDAFDAVVCGDDRWPKKPAGDMLVAACAQMASRVEETLMLGDSANDVLGARAAGCPVWCVPYGYNEGRPVESLACDRIVGSVDEAAVLVLAGA